MCHPGRNHVKTIDLISEDEEVFAATQLYTTEDIAQAPRPAATPSTSASTNAGRQLDHRRLHRACLQELRYQTNGEIPRSLPVAELYGRMRHCTYTMVDMICSLRTDRCFTFFERDGVQCVSCRPKRRS